MTDKIDNPCPKNPDHEYIATTIWYLDDFGQEVEQEDCENCQEESHQKYREQIENASNVDASSRVRRESILPCTRSSCFTFDRADMSALPPTRLKW